MRTPDHACSTIASVHSSSRRPNLISKRAGEEGLKNPGPNFDLLAPETRARRSTASPGEKTGARLEWKRGQSRRRCRTDPDPIPLRQSIPQAPAGRCRPGRSEGAGPAAFICGPRLGAGRMSPRAGAASLITPPLPGLRRVRRLGLGPRRWMRPRNLHRATAGTRLRTWYGFRTFRHVVTSSP
jgi:hypothetical protein